MRKGLCCLSNRSFSGRLALGAAAGLLGAAPAGVAIAQVEVLWRRDLLTPKSESAHAVCAVGAGGFVVTGWTGAALFGPHQGLDDPWLARYDAAGTLIASRQYGTSGSETFIDVACADGVNVWLSGRSEENSAFGGTPLGEGDSILARADVNGNIAFMRRIGTEEFESSAYVAADVAGAFIASSTQGDLAAPLQGNSDVFLARYDVAGTLQFVRQFGTPGNEHPAGIAPDGAGGVYVAWNATPAPAVDEVRVTRVDALGNILWTTIIDSTRHDAVLDIAADAGGVYAVGYSDGALAPGGGLSRDAWVARFAPSGGTLWIQQIGASGEDVLSGVAVDGSGAVIGGWTSGGLGGPVYVEGEYDAWAARYDGDGNRTWLLQFGGPGGEEVLDLVSDGRGGVIAVGGARAVPPPPVNGDGFVVRIGQLCRPDLTTTAIPGLPGYGQPNGLVTNDDFFYYLAAFAAGNLAIADLTTGAVPGQPGYGVPNGVLNNDDFLFYLGLFAQGC